MDVYSNLLGNNAKIDQSVLYLPYYYGTPSEVAIEIEKEMTNLEPLSMRFILIGMRTATPQRSKWELLNGGTYLVMIFKSLNVSYGGARLYGYFDGKEDMRNNYLNGEWTGLVIG